MNEKAGQSKPVSSEDNRIALANMSNLSQKGPRKAISTIVTNSAALPLAQTSGSAPPPKKDPEEQFAWLMITRDNVKPDPYGNTSTTKGRLSFQEVANLYSQRYGGTASQQAISKRLKNSNNLRKFHQAHPNYPKNISYNTPAVVSNKRKADEPHERQKRQKTESSAGIQKTSARAVRTQKAPSLKRKRASEGDDDVRKRVKLPKSSSGATHVDADSRDVSKNSDSEGDETDGCASDDEESDDEDGEKAYNSEPKRYKVTYCGAFHTGWNRNSIYVPPREITEKPYFPDDQFDSDDDDFEEETIHGPSQESASVSNPRRRINGSPVRYHQYPLHFNREEDDSTDESSESSDDGWSD